METYSLTNDRYIQQQQQHKDIFKLTQKNVLNTRRVCCLFGFGWEKKIFHSWDDDGMCVYLFISEWIWSPLITFFFFFFLLLLTHESEIDSRRLRTTQQFSYYFILLLLLHTQLPSPLSIALWFTPVFHGFMTIKSMRASKRLRHPNDTTKMKWNHCCCNGYHEKKIPCGRYE